jgi:hypothetical protein
MDAAAITSTARAVHQELVRKLAEQARTNRLRDQLRRTRSGAAASSPSTPGIAVGPSPAWPGTSAGRANPHAHVQPDAWSWLSPATSRSFSFSPVAPGSFGPAEPGGLAGLPGPVGPGLDGAAGPGHYRAAGVPSPGGAATLDPPAPPT